MLKELYALIAAYNVAINKLETLNTNTTAKIMEFVANRQTNTTMYQSMQKEREYRRGQIYSIKATIKQLEAIIQNHE